MDARIKKVLQSIYSQKEGEEVPQVLLNETYELLNEIEIDYQKKKNEPIFKVEVEQILEIKDVLKQFLNRTGVLAEKIDPQYIQNSNLSISKPKISDNSIKISTALSKTKIFFSKNLERIIYIFIILMLAGFTLNLWIACDC